MTRQLVTSNDRKKCCCQNKEKVFFLRKYTRMGDLSKQRLMSHQGKEGAAPLYQKTIQPYLKKTTIVFHVGG